jgi:hypothetical protein
MIPQAIAAMSKGDHSPDFGALWILCRAGFQYIDHRHGIHWAFFALGRMTILSSGFQRTEKLKRPSQKKEPHAK